MNLTGVEVREERSVYHECCADGGIAETESPEERIDLEYRVCPEHLDYGIEEYMIATKRAPNLDRITLEDTGKSGRPTCEFCSETAAFVLTVDG